MSWFRVAPRSTSLPIAEHIEGFTATVGRARDELSMALGNADAVAAVDLPAAAAKALEAKRAFGKGLAELRKELVQMRSDHAASHAHVGRAAAALGEALVAAGEHPPRSLSDAHHKISDLAGYLSVASQRPPGKEYLVDLSVQVDQAVVDVQLAARQRRAADPAARSAIERSIATALEAPMEYVPAGAREHLRSGLEDANHAVSILMRSSDARMNPAVRTALIDAHGKLSNAIVSARTGSWVEEQLRPQLSLVDDVQRRIIEAG